MINTTGQTVNNFLDHDESVQKDRLQKQLDDCDAEDNCTLEEEKAILAQINELDQLSADRKEALDNVCIELPGSQACAALVYEVQQAEQSFQNADGQNESFGIIQGESNETREISEHYTALTENPTANNVLVGAGNVTQEMIEGTVQLGLLGVNAIQGDEQALETLDGMYDAIVEEGSTFVDNPAVYIKNKAGEVLDSFQAVQAEIDQLESEGRYDEATQLKAELLTSGLFSVTGAGAVTTTVGRILVKSVDLPDVSGVTPVKNNDQQFADQDFYNDLSQGNSGPLIDYHEVSAQTNIQPEVLENIILTPKGKRPDPSTYMSQADIENHLSKFDNGASYLVPKSVLDDYGRDSLGWPDNSQFVMPKAEMDDLIKNANGDIRFIEKELGIPEGSWSSQMSRIDIDNPKDLRSL